MNDFEELYRLNEQILHKFLLRICNNESLADELTQETLYKAFLHLNEFKGQCKLSSWLCQIGKNEYFAYLNQRRHLLEVDVNEIAIEDVGSITQFQRIEREEDILSILSVALLLSTTYKEVFFERVIGNFSYAEIARLHQKSESWARVTFYRAKKKIIEEMGINGK